MMKIKKMSSSLIAMWGLSLASTLTLPSFAVGTFQSAAAVQTSQSSTTALTELTQLLQQNAGQPFSNNYPQFTALKLEERAAERAAEIILEAKLSLMTFSERRFSLAPANQSADGRHKIPGQYAHFYMNFYENLLNITSQNIIGRGDLAVTSDLPIKIAVLEQAIHALEETLKAKPNGSKPGTLYGWWSSSRGFNDYSAIEGIRIAKLTADLWARYGTLLRQHFQKTNQALPVNLASLLNAMGQPGNQTIQQSGAGYTPPQAPMTQPPFVPTAPYGPSALGGAPLTSTASQQMMGSLMKLADMNPQTNPNDAPHFQSYCQQLGSQAQDPQLQTLLTQWIQSNYPVLNPDPQAIIAQATSGYSPLASGYYQAAMIALQQAGARYPSYGFLIVRRGSQILQNTLQAQQMAQSQDYQSIQAALQSGLQGQIQLPQGYSRSVLTIAPQLYQRGYAVNTSVNGQQYGN